MKLNISMLILVFLSFFNIGAVSTDNMKICCFKDLEIRCKNDSSFVENGIKIQYTTENSIKQERDIICKYIQSNFVVNNYQINKNEISFDEKEIKIKVDLWNDNQYTYVVLTAINSNKSCNTEQLANMFKDLIECRVDNIQHYRYYKGQITPDEKNEYGKCINKIINNVNILTLNNGYTGNGYCNDGEKVNFAVSNYDTGAYIIIGTPIIFVTY
ncbi:hypothetical protein [uncultured Clostridium sp.]|uniref:hypothetical protein n=1 Tax=uncultured Clostridium sp. TaxID=59620 RepID=UPI0025D5922D|nr:hypothetical protein [uncultured Clostridium sp.]